MQDVESERVFRSTAREVIVLMSDGMRSVKSLDVNPSKLKEERA